METSKPKAEVPVNEPESPISPAEEGDREEVPSVHLAKDETNSAPRTRASTPTPSSEPHPLSGKLQFSRLAPPSGEQLEAKSVPNVAVACVASLHQGSMKTSSATMLLAKNYKKDHPSLCTGSKDTRATGSTPSLPIAKGIPKDARKKLGSSFHTLNVRKRDSNQQDGKLGERGALSPRPPNNQNVLPPGKKKHFPPGSRDLQEKVEPATKLSSRSTQSTKEKEYTVLEPKKTAKQTVEVAEGKIGEGESGKHDRDSPSVKPDHCYTKTEPVEQPPSNMKEKGTESKEQTKKNTEKEKNATTGSGEVGVGGELKKDSMEQVNSTHEREGDKDMRELAVGSKDKSEVIISVKEDEKGGKALEDGDKEEAEVAVGNKEGENEEDMEQVDEKQGKEEGAEEGKKEEKEKQLEEGKKSTQEEMEKERQINAEKNKEEDSKENIKERTKEVKSSKQVPVTNTESKDDKKPSNEKENNPAQESNLKHADTIPSDTTGEHQPHPLSKTPKPDIPNLKEEMTPTAQDEGDLSQSTVQATKAFSTSNLTRSTQSLNISSHTKNLSGTNMEPASTSKPNTALSSKSSLDRIEKKGVEKVSIDHSTGQSQSSIVEAVEISEPSPVTTET